MKQVSSSPIATSFQSPLPAAGNDGRVTHCSFGRLPEDLGQVLLFTRQFDDGAVRCDGWPLSGGVWELGAREIAHAQPQVPDHNLLPAAASLAEQLKTEGQSAQQFVGWLETNVGLHHPQLPAIAGQALELLGVSNRQLGQYAKTTIQMVSTLGHTDSSALLIQTMRARAAIDDLLHGVNGCAARLGLALTIDGARDALVCGGLDAGLNAADAENNARWLLEQLHVFSSPRASGEAHSSASEDDLRAGRQTLSSQQSLATAADEQRVIARLAAQMWQMDFTAPAPNDPPADAADGARIGRKPSREDAPMLAGVDGLPRVRVRSDSRESTGVSRSVEQLHRAGSGPRMPVLATARSAGAQLSGLTVLQQKLVDCERGGRGYFAQSAFQAWAESALRSGLVAGNVALGDFEHEMHREVAMNKLDLLPIVRDEALALLRRHLSHHNVVGGDTVFRHVAAARCFPLPVGLARDAAAAEQGRVVVDPALGVLIAYPAHLDLSGCSAEQTGLVMRTMLRLLFSAHVSLTLAGQRGIRQAFSVDDMLYRLRQMLHKVRYAPRSKIELSVPLHDTSALVWLLRVVIDGLSDALAARVLGVAPARAPEHHMDWDTLLARALDGLTYQPAIYQGLIRGDARVQSSIFVSIANAVQRWQQAACPQMKHPDLLPLVDELAALANGADASRSSVTRDEVMAKLEIHFQDLIAAHIQPDSPTLRGHTAVAYLHRALLAPTQPEDGQQFGDSIIGSSVLALVSGHEGATQKLLEKLRDEATRSPQQFVTEFLGDD